MTDYERAVFALVMNVLRRFAQNREGINLVVIPNGCVTIHHHMSMEMTAIANLNMLTNDTIRPDDHILA
jgi:hypothetical protein